MKKVRIIKRTEKNIDYEFWKTKTPEERLDAVELLREQCYLLQGYERLPLIIRKISIRGAEKNNRSK